MNYTCIKNKYPPPEGLDIYLRLVAARFIYCHLLSRIDTSFWFLCQ